MTDYNALAGAIINRASFALTQAAQNGNRVTPAVATYQDWTFGRGISKPLPRDLASFLEGAFGPGMPTVPATIDAGDGDDRPEPRRFEYPVSWNMTGGSPGSEGLKLAAFVQLRAYADLYSLVRSAIEVRKQEILGIEWEIVPTRAAQLEHKQNEGSLAEWTERKEQATKFFKRPDTNYPNYHSWMSAFLEDLFVVDAPCLYLHPSRLAGKGVLGSDLASLDLIDGTTIRPLLDMRGSAPAPPNPAYQQYIWGVPRTDLMSVILGNDIGDASVNPIEQYRGDQLLYLPYIRRTWTPYGFPGIERALMPVVTGLKKQQFALEFFTEGSIPGMFVIPGPGIDTPEQIKKLQDTLNFLAGDQSWKHKIIVLPHGSSSEQHKKQEIASQYDEQVAVEVCMAYEVNPSEIGFPMGMHHKGLSIGGSAHAADTADEARQRKATKPLLRWCKASVFDFVLQQVLEQADMEWSWVGWQDEDDQGAKSERMLNELKVGARTIDEYRKESGQDPLGFPATQEPIIISPDGGVTPLAHLDTAAVADLLNDPPEKQPAPAADKPKADDSKKAALDELEKLRRFIKKGRSAADWKPEHLPVLLHQAVVDGLTISSARALLAEMSGSDSTVTP